MASTPTAYPHIAERNGQAPEIPDPPFGQLDPAVIQQILGEASLNVARWATFAQLQQQTIAALREQLAALQAELAAASARAAGLGRG